MSQQPGDGVLHAALFLGGGNVDVRMIPHLLVDDERKLESIRPAILK